MPRYRYVCSDCDFTKVFFHGINESIEICENCNKSTMIKDYSASFTVNSEKEKSTAEVGEITKEYIEENKKILKQQKKEAKSETYEPT